MFWIFIFINSDRTPINITVDRFRYLSTLIGFHSIHGNMCWIFINLICVGHLSSWYDTNILSTWYVLDIYQVDMSPKSINLICVGYLSTVICLQNLSTWYVLVFIKLIEVRCLSSWYNSNISINLICVGYLSSW
jgi:hypothetical protein